MAQLGRSLPSLCHPSSNPARNGNVAIFKRLLLGDSAVLLISAGLKTIVRLVYVVPIQNVVLIACYRVAGGLDECDP